MKNIAIIRTSTIKQEVESQKKEIENCIRKDNQEEIVVIGGAGASAIKLDDQYMNNLNKVYSTMEKGDIVWAWSIDRIGRNEEILMAFKNRLIKEGVNLRICNPSLTLLNSDGTVNAGVELAFSLFATMAKQEMELKKERFKRAKQRNREEGKTNGGKPLYGYKITEEGKFLVDETKPVRKIFFEYADTPISVYGLARKYAQHFTPQTTQSLRSSLCRLLKNKRYVGNSTYPAIVPIEIYERVQEKMATAKSLPKIDYTGEAYWLQGLLYQRFDNSDEEICMKPFKRELCYRGKNSISMRISESLVYTVLQRVFDEYSPTDLIEEIREQNRQIQAKKDVATKELEKLYERDRELDERYFLTGTVKNYDTLKAALGLKIKELQTQVNNLRPIEETIEKPTLDGLDDWQVKDVFMNNLQRVFVYVMGNHWFKLDIITRLGVSVPVLLVADNKKGRTKYKLPNEDWQVLDVFRSLGRIAENRSLRAQERRRRKKEAEKEINTF